MDFTVEFIQMFFVALWYMAPLIGLLVAVIIILGRITGIREGWSRSESLYYAFITATTVGYGDFHPRKGVSRVLAVAISFVGIVLTGIIVAIALQAALHAFRNTPDFKQMSDVVEQIDEAYK